MLLSVVGVDIQTGLDGGPRLVSFGITRRSAICLDQQKKLVEWTFMPLLCEISKGRRWQEINNFWNNRWIFKMDENALLSCIIS